MDIPERLRALAHEYHQHRPHYTEAADEIERLRTDLKNAVWSDSEECKILNAENARLRAQRDQLLAACNAVMTDKFSGKTADMVEAAIAAVEDKA